MPGCFQWRQLWYFNDLSHNYTLLCFLNLSKDEIFSPIIYNNGEEQTRNIPAQN